MTQSPDRNSNLASLSTATLAIFTLSSEGKVTSWNEGAELLVGFHAQEIIGKHFTAIHSIENLRRERPSEVLKLAVSAGTANYADWHVKKDGSHFWASLKVTANRAASNDAFTYTVEMQLASPTNQVAERLRARNVELEEQLGERTAQLGERTAQLGTRTEQLGQRTEQLGQRTEQLGERTVELGQRTAQLGVRTEQLGVRTEQLGVRTDELGNQTTQLDERTTELNAKTKQFNSSEARNVELGEQLGQRTAQLGERTAQLGVRTEQLDTRTEELGVRTDELGNQTTQLGERTIQLSAKTAEFNTVEALNKELEAFTYAASHDLRAPLRSIDGFSLALLEDYSDKLDADGKSHLNRIRACAQRMGQLIDDLIGLSSLTRGNLKLTSCDISVESRKIAEELQRTKPERVVNFVIAEALKADCDLPLLRIVLENLVGNAFKYTSKRKSAEIEIGSQESDDGPVYFIRDNGAGFDMKYVHKLFGPFQRLHSTSEFEGNGIGLATVQRIINRHGGQVWVESKVDLGTTVFFTF